MRSLRIIFLLLVMATAVHAQMQNIGGIGAQLIIDTVGGYAMPRIFSLVPNSPAYQSLNATDYIIKVDNVSCKDKTIEQVVALIRGEAGTKVKITTSFNKDGKDAKDTLLERVNMQVAGQPDPTTAFYSSCESEVQQLKKSRTEIVKTFNSDCGNYFFNFNADAGTYHIRVITMEDKPAGTAAPKPSASAKVYDGDNEKNAVTLAPSGTADKGSWLDARLEGAITFSRSGVGVISISIPDNAKKCRAMYIVVYK